MKKTTKNVRSRDGRHLPVAGWTDCLEVSETLSALRDIARKHLPFTGRFRPQLESALQKMDWRELLSVSFDYSYDDDPETLYHARQVRAFFEKFEQLPLNVDKEQVAYEKFIQAEQQCRATNEVLRLWSAGKFSFPRSVEAILYLAQRKISQILGPLPSLAQLPIQFGPGATTSVRKSSAAPRIKLGKLPACSYEMEPLLGRFLETIPAYAELHAVGFDSAGWIVEYEVAEGKLQFVTKNAETYRSIIIEPTVNGLYQQGLGRSIRKCLFKVGVDLSNQGRNQSLACSGSKTGAIATLDLRSASDCNAYELVWNLLPFDWAEALTFGRTGNITYRGTSMKLEKFSSMGNAYTFELESLIFYGLAWATCSHLGLPTGWTSVFGDDLIVPSEAAAMLTQVLTCVGFEVNSKKSFTEGPFRESCGHDYFLGVEIRPYYQKNLMSVETLFSLHNFYKRYGYDRFAEGVVKLIPPHLRLFGPDGYGDGHLIGNCPKVRKPDHVQRGWEGWVFSTFTHKKRKHLRANRGDYVLPHYSIYVRGDADDEIEAGEDRHDVVPGTNGYKRVSIYVLGE